MWTDLFGFVCLTTTITVGLTIAPIQIWALILWSLSVRYNSEQMLETEWCNWFEVLKCASVIAGAAAFTLGSDTLLPWLLAVNIVEAIVSDIQTLYTGVGVLNGLVNVLLGTYLVGNIQLPLDIPFIVLYTLWNISFSYRNNFSLSTRMILVAPILTTIVLQDTSVWLCARCMSLLLNMILRASEKVVFYKPGNVLTQIPNTFVHSPRVATCIGTANILVLIYVLFDIF